MNDGPQRWALGLYAGPSPLALTEVTGVNPVLDRWQLGGPAVDFVADPFLLRHAGGWALYFEVLPTATQRGEIGYAESLDGRRFDYRGIALAEPFHLSYPLAFTHQGWYYLLPETLGAGALRLYRSASPAGPFAPLADLLPGRFADPTLFHHAGRWWLFACPTPEGHDGLELFCAEDLLGPWRRHPASPIVEGDPRTARPAGRVVEHAGRLYRFAQDCQPRYGSRVVAFEILELCPERYREVPAGPVLTPTGTGWNGDRMHHLDAHRLEDGSWLAVADGYGLGGFSAASALR